MISVPADTLHPRDLVRHGAEPRCIAKYGNRRRDEGKYWDQNSIAFDTAHDSDQTISGVLQGSDMIGIVFRHAERIDRLAHSHPPVFLWGQDCISLARLSTQRGHCLVALQSRIVEAELARESYADQHPHGSSVSSSVVAFSVAFGGVSCRANHRVFRIGNTEKSADRSRQVRTEMSARSFRSVQRASVSAISPASHGRLRPRPIFRISPATTRGHAGAGSPATLSRQPRPLASSWPRSCAGFINGIEFRSRLVRGMESDIRGRQRKASATRRHRIVPRAGNEARSLSVEFERSAA